jgi:UDPglucose--hexose-1-phosphate uridylyltransferase
MSEIRKDPFLDRWVVLAPHRENRPRSSQGDASKEDCPFCPGHESETPPEVLALGRPGGHLDTSGWQVRAFRNKYPAFDPEANAPAVSPPFLVQPARGEHEVIVTSPDHHGRWSTFSDEHGGLVLEAVSRRREALSRIPGIGYVLTFENAGEGAGATLPHPHLQMMGLPQVAPVVLEETRRAEAWHDSEGTCPFCHWIDAETRSEERVLSAGPDMVTLLPFAPRFPFEFWILPRVHRSKFPGPGDPLLTAIAKTLRDNLATLEIELGRVSYNWVLHSASPGDAETPFFHWHIEVLPNTVRTAGFEWGTGLFLHHLFPEEAARRLRRARPPRNDG